MLQLEQLRERLTTEGLLDPSRKRPLPPAPRIVGVVTSPTGAAIHDILEVARRRCPSRILLSPALVQGDGAPRSLRRALTRLSSVPGVDVIILGRGGGSTEDLWGFNDEALARAVADCPVPVVSAVGHEVDVTACDWVSDLRAATPSHAAELVIPDRRRWEDGLRRLEQRLRRGLERRMVDETGRLDTLVRRLARGGGRLASEPRARLRLLERRLASQHPRVRVGRDRRKLDALRARLVAAGRALPGPARMRLARAAGALDALSPLSVLQRGYAVVTTGEGKVIVDASTLTVGDALDVRFRRGTASVTVSGTHPPDDD